MAKRGSKAWKAEQAKLAYEENFARSINDLCEAFNLEASKVRPVVEKRNNCTLVNGDGLEIRFEFIESNRNFIVWSGGEKRSNYMHEDSGRILCLDHFGHFSRGLFL